MKISIHYDNFNWDTSAVIAEVSPQEAARMALDHRYGDGYLAITSPIPSEIVANTTHSGKNWEVTFLHDSWKIREVMADQDKKK